MNKLLLLIMICIVLKPAQAQTTNFSKTYAAPSHTFSVESNSFIEATGHSYLVTGKQSLLYKMDATGTILWSKRIGDMSVSYKKIIKTKDANFILVGDHHNPLKNQNNIICVKVNASGDTLWSKEISQSGDSYASSVESTNDGGCVIVGSMYAHTPPGSRIVVIKMEADGKLQWSRSIVSGNDTNYGYSIKQIPDNGYAIALDVSDTSLFGETNAALIRLNSAGSIVWTNRYRNSTQPNTRVTSLEITPSGIILTLSVTNDYKLVIMKTDFSGTLIWHKAYNLATNTQRISIRAVSGGGFITTGVNPGSGLYRETVLKLDSVGMIQWNKEVFYMRATDIMESSDYGYMVLGIGAPGSMLPYQSGIVKMDASGNGTDCIANTTVAYSTIDLSVTPLISSEILEGASVAWYPAISPVSIISSTGCLPEPMSIEETSLKTVSIYPNPAISNVTMNGLEWGDLVEVYDPFGKRVYKTVASSEEEIMDVSSFAKGMYVYAVTKKNYLVSRGKIIIQ